MTDILLVEDEARAAKRLTRLLEEYPGEALRVNHCSSLGDSLDRLEKMTPDLLLLDLQLDGESGFELLKQSVAGAFHTIIVSAYTEKALEAFEYGVLDFVPKPVMPQRLYLALDRYFGAAATDKTLKYLAVKRAGKIKLLPLEQIHHLKAAGHYSEIVLANNRTLLHEKSLEKLEMLLPSNFMRVHKSYLANMSYAMAFLSAAGSKYQLEMEGGILLPVGRSRFREVKAILMER